LVDRLAVDLVTEFQQRIAGADPALHFRSGSEALHARGLAVRGAAEEYFATAAAHLLFAPRPSDRFPQCEILADAYDEPRVTGRPKGQLNVNAPLPRAVEQVIGFIDQHTFHPRRVVGLNNVRLDEYPVPALREALVNAVAHRSYDDASRKLLVRIFSDRIEIANPGYPLRPLTMAKLRRGDYRPCSRNPLIAQALASLGKMEQRGSGFARMREAMLNHGLEEPKLGEQDGFFVLTLPGPAGAYDRIKVSADAGGPITPAVEARLNERQKKIVLQVQQAGFVTSGWCRKRFGVAYLTVNRDLNGLVRLGVFAVVGKGRSTRYVTKATTS
jgi:predicted HTH transcriptional regulator